MNLANRITIVRVFLIVPFVLFMVSQEIAQICDPYTRWIALTIFIVASLTDTVDGIVARKWNMVSNFGKFMDPLADKLLVSAALICLNDIGAIPSWMVIVIISREFIISGFRLIASDKGVVIAASKWGKAKTIIQMIMIGLMIGDLEFLRYVTIIFMWVSLLLTLISLFDYIWKNRKILSDHPAEPKGDAGL